MNKRGYVQETLEAIEEQIEDLSDYVQDEWSDEANRVIHKLQEAIGPLRSARDGAEELNI